MLHIGSLPIHIPVPLRSTPALPSLHEVAAISFPSLRHVPVAIPIWLVQQVFFHIFGLLFEYFDQTSTLPRAKQSDTTRRRPYVRLLPRVLFNQTFILLPSMIAAELLGWCFAGPEHLAPMKFVSNLLFMGVGHDVVQYLVHRELLHRPNLRLMKFLRHSVHHSNRANTAISACYMSPPDFFLEIVLPYLVPLMLVGGGGRDLFFHCLLAGTGAIGGLYEHSGYDFSLLFGRAHKSAPELDGDLPLLTRVVTGALASLLNNRAHTEHHLRGNVSFSDGFGSPSLCDTLFGTRWDLSTGKRTEVESEWQKQRREHDERDERAAHEATPEDRHVSGAWS